jgi:AmiR/NasT family two-component response regulator
MIAEFPPVFIVEDEALLAMERRERLTQLGYHVCGVAAHGEKALQQISGSGAEVVLMASCSRKRSRAKARAEGRRHARSASIRSRA